MVCDNKRDWHRAVPALVSGVQSWSSYATTCINVLVPNHLALLHKFEGPGFQELRGIKLSMVRPYEGAEQTKLKEALVRSKHEQEQEQVSRVIQLSRQAGKIVGTALSGAELFHMSDVEPSMLIGMLRDRIGGTLHVSTSTIMLLGEGFPMDDAEAVGQRKSFVVKQILDSGADKPVGVAVTSAIDSEMQDGMDSTLPKHAARSDSILPLADEQRGDLPVDCGSEPVRRESPQPVTPKRRFLERRGTPPKSEPTRLASMPALHATSATGLVEKLAGIVTGGCARENVLTK